MIKINFKGIVVVFEVLFIWNWSYQYLSLGGGRHSTLHDDICERIYMYEIYLESDHAAHSTRHDDSFAEAVAWITRPCQYSKKTV